MQGFLNIYSSTINTYVLIISLLQFTFYFDVKYTPTKNCKHNQSVLPFQIQLTN